MYVYVIVSMYTYKKKCDHYSSAETIQGRKLLIIKRFWPRKLFKGGNYSRAETIRGNTVVMNLDNGQGPRHVLDKFTIRT